MCCFLVGPAFLSRPRRPRRLSLSLYLFGTTFLPGRQRETIKIIRVMKREKETELLPAEKLLISPGERCKELRKTD